MKTTNIFLNKKRYYFLTIFVISLNLIVGGILLKKSFGQNTKDFENQPPIDIRIKDHEGNPLKIIILNVDNSNPRYQRVDYTIQNVSDIGIKAYTITSDIVLTQNFTSKLFEVGKSSAEEFFIERSNIRNKTELEVSIDYVLFRDGSNWGNDTEKSSEEIIGFEHGQKTAVDELLIEENGNIKVNILKNPFKERYPSSVDLTQTHKWQKGFKRGYRSVFSQLKYANAKGGIKSANSRLKKLKELLIYEGGNNASK